MKALAGIFALVPIAAVAGVITAQWQLPNWAQPQWAALSKSQQLELSLRLNPFVWQGDFDGDKALDVAVLVKRSSDGKEGIAVLWRNEATPTVVGAGTSIGGGGDDFSWVEYWGVEESGSLHEGSYAETIRLDADALLVTKEGSATGLIYFVDRKPQWQQQSD
jgi:hypothetical protein